MPPGENGWQRNKRLAPNHPPFHGPCTRTASMKYSLHEGQNLHVPISKGEMPT